MGGGYMTLSPVAQKLLASQRTAAEFPYLIKITHPDFADMFYANSSENIFYKGNVYNPASFTMQLPDLEGPEIGAASLSISAVDQYWIQRIRDLKTPAEMQFVAVIVYDDAAIEGIEQLDENSFTLRMAQWDEQSITWELSFDERQAYIITSIKCTPQVAPGCA
jgi:hypothetical protein